MLQASERGLCFAHALIARAVYNDISPLRRQVMHRRIAELLQKDSAQELARAADLAHHATLSGDPGLAARAMVSAGRLCLRFFANDDALSLARKGLQLVSALADAERVCAEIDLHDILLAAGPLADRESAAQTYAALAERALGSRRAGPRSARLPHGIVRALDSRAMDGGARTIFAGRDGRARRAGRGTDRGHGRSRQVPGHDRA